MADFLIGARGTGEPMLPIRIAFSNQNTLLDHIQKQHIDGLQRIKKEAAACKYFQDVSSSQASSPILSDFALHQVISRIQNLPKIELTTHESLYVDIRPELERKYPSLFPTSSSSPEQREEYMRDLRKRGMLPMANLPIFVLREEKDR
jgi:hypothetical protein